MSDENDVEKLKIEIERLKRLVYCDELTGLLNRRGFYEEINGVFNALSFGQSDTERRIGAQIPFSVVFLDIDDFKKVNDSYGHEAGDEVLKIVGQSIQGHFRVGDISARWGGEEFVIAIPDMDDEELEQLAKSIGGKMKTDLAKRAKLARAEVTTSMGAKIAHKGDTEVVDEVDKLLYKAKEGGRNRAVMVVDGKEKVEVFG